MTFQITTRDAEYAVDVFSALAITRVTEVGTGHDAGPDDLPEDFRECIADYLAEQWAERYETRLIEPAERNLARHIVRALLPDPDGDEQDLEDLLRARWTQPGRRAA